MIKMITQFKSVIQDFETTFNFASNCPTSVAKEAIFDALKWIGQIEDQGKAAAAAAEKKQETSSESPVEVPEQPIE